MLPRWYTKLRVWKGERVAIMAYIGLLAAEYRALDPRAIPSEHQQLYEEIDRDLTDWTRSEGARMPDWTQLCTLEIRLVHLLSLDAVRMKLPLVRERLREVAGPEAYAAYYKIVPPDGELVQEALRECLKQLVSEFHLYFRIWSWRERSRVALTWLAGLGLVLGGLLGYGLTKLSVASEKPAPFGSFPAVLIMGAMGGFVSMYLRMQTVDLRVPALSALLDSRYGRYSIMIAPVFGAAFAGLLLLLFAGGLIEGQLFPKVIPVGSNFMSLFLETHAQDPVHMVKLLVWSFVAGFAERLVPNVLNRLASDEDKPKER